MCLSQDMQRAFNPMGNIENSVLPKGLRNVNEKIGPDAMIKRMSTQQEAPKSILSAPTATQQVKKPDPAAAFYLPQNP